MISLKKSTFFLAIFFMITIGDDVLSMQNELDEVQNAQSTLPIKNQPSPTMALYDRMALFGSLFTKSEQQYILLATLYNDLRLFEDCPQKRHEIMKKFLGHTMNDFKSEFSKIKLTKLNKENWQSQIIEVSQQLLKIPGTKPLDRNFALNVWLYQSGLCPLVYFAFDRWYDLDLPGVGNSESRLEALSELSTTFLYRLVPVKEVVITDQKIGDGAYSNVYLSKNGKSIYKIPRNVASFRFAAHEEYLASLYALKTGLAPYVPALLAYKEEEGILEREFIEGPTGFNLLGEKREFFSDLQKLKQIEEIYNIACAIYETDGVNFDIHPGNFIWSESNMKWFLVDLGPMPKIGADYFPRKNFQEYFQKIWLDLHGLMVTVPIRSLDIQMSPQQFSEITDFTFDKNITFEYFSFRNISKL